MPDRVALEVERKRKLEERERKFKEFCDKHPKLVQWGEKLRAMVSATNFGGIMLVSMLFSVFGGLAGFLLNVCTWLIKGTAFSIAHVEWGIRIAFIILLLKRGRPSRKDMIGVITLFILGVLLIPAVLAGLGSAVSHGDCSWGLLRLMVGWCLFVAGPICGVEAAKSLYSLYEFKRIGYVHPGRLILYSFFVFLAVTVVGCGVSLLVWGGWSHCMAVGEIYYWKGLVELYGKPVGEMSWREHFWFVVLLGVFYLGILPSVFWFFFTE